MVGTQIEERKEAVCAICLGEEGSVEHESAAVSLRKKWLAEEGGRTKPFVREQGAGLNVQTLLQQRLGLCRAT